MSEQREQKIPRIFAGFTLIELMFVVVVLGVLATTGVLFYQQRVQNQKIEKTVTQMEQWMQAGMAYYIRNNRWPDSAGQLMSNGYMPLDADKNNPWCRAGDGVAACYLIQPGAQNPRGQLLTVEAIIMGKDSVRRMIAERLAYVNNALLPNRVVAWVNVPFAATTTQYRNDMVVKTIPFNLTSDDVVLEYSFFMMKEPEGKAVGKIPDCSALYGADYHYNAYAIVSEYSADIDFKQQPLFSELGVFFKKNDTNDILLNLRVRANRYDLEAFSWGIAEHILSFAAKTVPTTFRMKGQIFVMCERKKTGTDKTSSDLFENRF